jgi:hypothetical protein
MAGQARDKRSEVPQRLGVDHFVLDTRANCWNISTVMARHVERCLDAEPRPAWITFVDLTGARIRIRSQDVESLAQSTADQRAAGRALHRGWNKESRNDPDWADDD